MKRREFFQGSAAALAACALPAAVAPVAGVAVITAIDMYAGTITVSDGRAVQGKPIPLDQFDLVNSGSVTRFEVGKPTVWGFP